MKKNRYIARVLLVIFFAALLATPVVLKRWYARNEAKKNESAQDSLKRYGFQLKEVAREAGISFTHTAPKLDSKLDHIMPQVASMGAGVSVVDFDRDGWQISM